MLVLVTASALLAAWIVVRFPRVNPSSGSAITVAIVAAAVIAVGCPQVIPVVGIPLGGMATIFVIVLPSSVYLFVVAAWIMLFVKRAIEPYLRS